MKEYTILAVSFALFLVFGVPYSVSAYTIDGNIVYINDENVFLSADPHTFTETDCIMNGQNLPVCPVVFTLISKRYSGNITAVWGFDTENIKPVKAQIWAGSKWEPLNKEYDILYKEYDGKNKWFLFDDVDIIEGHEYKLRIWMNVLNPAKGKYDFAIKPAAESFPEAVASGHLYMLDPWYDSNYIFKRAVNAGCTACSGDVTMPILINDTASFLNGTTPQYIWCNYTVTTSSSVVGYIYYNNETDYICINSAENANVRMDVDEGNATGYGNPWRDDALVVAHLNGSAYDSSVWANHGTIISDNLTASGKIGMGAYLNGSGSYVAFPTNARQTLTNKGTMMGWVYFDAVEADDRIMFHGDQNIWYVRLDGGSSISVRSYDGNNDDVDSGIVPTAKEWYHIAAVLDSGTSRIYINGTEKNSGGTGNLNYCGGDKSIALGSNIGGTAGFLYGMIDEFRFYNNTLSADEIMAHYNNTVGTHGFSILGEESEFVLNLSITFPENSTYIHASSFDLIWNFTSLGAGGCNWSAYSLNGGANVSTGCANTTITPGIGSNSITIWMNDSEGNIGYETIYFTMHGAIVDCSESYANDSIYFYFYEEDDLVAVNGSAKYTFRVLNVSYDYNGSVSNATNFTICVYGGNWEIDMTMIYEHSGYDQRSYYFYHATLSNATIQNISLYHILSADSEKTEINVRNANDNPVEGAYINIQRYYVDENKYRTVSIGKTDSTGKFLAYLYPDTVFYKFIVSLVGTVSNTYSPMTITDTADDPETLTLYTSVGATQFFDVYESVGGSCYVNFTTNYTICTVADGTGMFTHATLLVERTMLSGYTTVCKVSDSGSAITLSCYLGDDPNGTYRYALYGTPSPNPYYILAGDTFTFPSPSIYGDFGLFVSAIMFMGIGMLAVFSAPLAMILGILSLAVGSMLGFIEISIGSVVGLVVVAVIILFKGRGI